MTTGLTNYAGYHRCVIDTNQATFEITSMRNAYALADTFGLKIVNVTDGAEWLEVTFSGDPRALSRLATDLNN